MKRAIAAIYLTVAFACAEANEVSFVSLTNAVHDAQWIIRGKVLKVERKDSGEESRVEYLVAPTRVIKGIPSVPPDILLTYVEKIPVIKDKDGKVVGPSAPIGSGVGKEYSVQKDDEWIFLLLWDKRPAGKETRVLRVEPTVQEDEIKSILSQQGALPPPGAPQPGRSEGKP